MSRESEAAAGAACHHSRMAFRKGALEAQAWTQGGHPLERKKVAGDTLPILIEFQPGFVDPNLCVRGHVIYVLRGALGLELESGRERIQAGECCVIDTGTSHRAFNDGPEPVVLFIASGAS